MRPTTTIRHRRNRHPGRGGVAFTLIEVIVVVVLLAVVAALAVPRLAGFGGGRGRVAGEALGELLSVAARRDELTSQRIALDGDAARVRLLALVVPDAGGPPEWRSDVLIPDVELGGAVVTGVAADGVELDPKRWRVEFPQTSRRPSMRVLVAEASSRETWRVEMASSGSRATVVREGSGASAADGSIDLDLAGRGDQAW